MPVIINNEHIIINTVIIIIINIQLIASPEHILTAIKIGINQPMIMRILYTRSVNLTRISPGMLIIFNVLPSRISPNTVIFNVVSI